MQCQVVVDVHTARARQGAAVMTESLMQNARCIVVGSAPSVALPTPCGADCYTGANAGGRIIADHGLRVDVLVTTAYMLRDGGATLAPNQVHTRKQLAGLAVRRLWVDTRDGPLSAATSWAHDFSLSYEEAVGVSSSARATMTTDVFGRQLGHAADPSHRISTGLFAACLALASGAAEVILCGISLEGGNHRLKHSTIRTHAHADKLALELLATNHPDRVRTTSCELADQFDIRRAA